MATAQGRSPIRADIRIPLKRRFEETVEALGMKKYRAVEEALKAWIADQRESRPELFKDVTAK